MGCLVPTVEVASRIRLGPPGNNRCWLLPSGFATSRAMATHQAVSSCEMGDAHTRNTVHMGLPQINEKRSKACGLSSSLVQLVKLAECHSDLNNSSPISRSCCVRTVLAQVAVCFWSVQHDWSPHEFRPRSNDGKGKESST